MKKTHTECYGKTEERERDRLKVRKWRKKKEVKNGGEFIIEI